MITDILSGKRIRSKRSFKKIAALAIFIVACNCYKPAVAQSALDKLGLDIGTPATGAYSLRLLSAAYTGPLLRTNINGVYYDVYPDASAAGALSLGSTVSAAYVNYNDAKTGATANTFGTILGSNNAFVAIWYDQSGSGNDVVQSDPNYQPYVALSGQLSTSNGLPAMMFQGRFLRAVLPSLDPVTPHTLIGVASAATGNIVALSSTTAGYQNSCLGSSRGGQSAAWFGGYFEDSFYETGTNTAALSIRSKTYTSADSTIRGYFNGSYVYAINPAIAFNTITYNPYNLTTPDILIGYQNTFTSGSQVFGEFQALNGSASEVLVFTTALNTAARQAVESNESAYYGVSYTADAPQGPTTGSPLTLDKAGLGSGVQATGAYSVRRLSSAYTGPLARITTFNNSGFPPTYYDVYPDATTGAIASTSPIAPVGSAPDAAAHASTGGTLNDLVQTGATYRMEQWYDQSGNGNNVLNYTLSRQPILINSGALVTNPSGSPAFSFGGYLQGRLASLNPATAHTLNGVAAGTTGDIITLSSAHATGQNSAVGISNTFNTAGAYGGWGQAGFSTGPATSAAGIRSKVYSPGSINGYFNGANIFVNNTVTYNLTSPDILIGAETSISQFLNGTLSEAFAFTSALSDADLRSLEKNQASFYKIPYHQQNTVSKLLDSLTTAGATPAIGAYALRLLNKNYTGPLVRLNINNSYYDVYPDTSATQKLSLSSTVSNPYTNYNDPKVTGVTAFLSTILGSNNAFVAIWYDQSGSGNDEVQSDPSYQPYVALSGQLTTANGLPAMMFQGRYLRAVLPSLDPVTPHTLIGVASAADGNIVALSSTAAGYQNSCLGSSRSDQSAAWFGGFFEDSFFETGANTAALSIRSKTYTSADSTIRGYFNGSYVFAMNPAIALNTLLYNPYSLTTPDILIGYQNTFVSGGQLAVIDEPLNGSASEVLVFTTALNTAARQAIESNEAAYYGVSYTADAPQGTTTGSPLTLDKAGLGSGVQATGAYSVRRLSSAYTGPLARLVLFSNVSLAATYYDVYPDAATGAIASSSPIAPVGSAPDAAVHVSTGGTLNDLMQTGSTYFVEKWYDQSGNGNNVLNYTRSRQPTLINSGALVTNPGGSPAFSFGGYLQGRLPSLNPATAHTLNGVVAGTTGDIITLSSTHATGQNSAVGISNTFNTAGAYGGWGQAGFSTGPATSSAGIRSKVYTPGSINGYFNGADIFVNNTVTYNLTTPDILIGAETSISQFLNGTLSEAFAFTSALSNADLRSLEKNQANYYNILYTTKADTLLLAGATNPANAADINYTLTFEDTVTGLTAGNFSLSASGGITGASIGTPVTADGGLNWTIPVHTGSGDGTLILSLNNAQNLSMGLSNSLPLVADTVTIDKTAPTVTISAPSVTAIGAGGPGTVSYTVTYADANFNGATLSPSDITLNTINGASGTVGVSNSGTTSTVTISAITGAGTIGISIGAGTASDLAGNLAPAAGASATFNVTPAPIAISSIVPVGSSPTHATSVDYTVTFASGISGLSTGNFTAASTGTASGTVSNVVAVSSSVYTVTVNGITGDGPLALNLDNATGLTPGISNTLPFAGGAYTIDNTLPTALTFSYSSNHSGNPQIADAGDVVSLDFTASEQVQTPALTIAGHAVTVVNIGGNEWLGSYTMVSADTEGRIPFTLSFADIAGNPQAGAPYNDVAAGDDIEFVSNIATLASLSASNSRLAPGFIPAKTSYRLTVGDIDFFTLIPTATDPAASITVNGVTVASGSVSQNIPLIIGSNPVSVVVTSSDNSTVHTYTITVTRMPSANANLSSLSISNTRLSPAFSKDITSYTAAVGLTRVSVTATPVAARATTLILINGHPVASGAQSAPITLGIGVDTITAVVTAQDSITTKTYTVIINHLSANANIVSVKLNHGILSPAFKQTNNSYTAEVDNTVSTITVKPFTSDALATVTVNGTPVVSRTASAPIALNVGDNTITVIGLAPNRINTKTYTIVVTRDAPAPANSRYEPISVSSPANTPQLTDNITVHQGVSPNGDGINDVLVIDGITAYPDNKLSIMSRNGELVFEATGYDNSSKIFDGHSGKNGKMQPQGTYFYSLEYKVDGVTKHQTGFIVLKY